MQSLVSYQGSSHTNLRSGSAFISLGKVFDSKAKLKSLAFDAVCVYLNYTDYMFPKHTNIVACPSGHYCHSRLPTSQQAARNAASAPRKMLMVQSCINVLLI